MKKLNLLKSMMLLCMLMVGMGAWAQDVIDYAATSSKLNGTATSTWVNAFDLTLSSGAVVNVRSMGTKNTSNALQWNANGYLYMKTSGGTLKSVTIKGASKTVNVYASNTAYSAAPSGTALGTISVTSEGATYNFTSDYTYLALKGTASSTTITEITIEYDEDGDTHEITAENTLNIPYTEGDGTFNVKWTGMEDVDVSLYNDAECTSEFTGSWFQADLDKDNNIYYVTEENTNNISRTVYMQLYGLDSQYEEYTHVVTVTQAAAPNKYAVNITAPANGTLEVTCGGEDVVSGNTYVVGQEINIVATPADGYKFRNIQVVDATTHTFTSSNEKVWKMGEHNVTITANFDEIQYYTINYMVNGVNTNAQENVIEGTTLVFPTPAAINGKQFMGWVETEIDGSTDDAPSFVNTTDLTATANKTYYAVFVTVTGSPEPIKRVTLDFVGDNWNIPAGSSNKRVEETNYTYGGYTITLAGSTGEGYYIAQSTAATPTKWALLFGKQGAFLTLPQFSFSVNKIVCKKTLGGSPSGKVTWNVYSGDTEVSTEATGCTNAETEFVISKNNKDDQLTIKVTNANNLQISSIDIYEDDMTYSDYCTTVATPDFVVTTVDTDFYSLYLDHAVSVPSNVTAYTGSLKGNTLTLSPVEGTIPANTGVVFKTSAAGNATFVAAADVAPIANNDIHGVAVDTPVSSIEAGAGNVVLVLGVVDGTVCFAQPNSETLGANKAYIIAPAANAGAKGIRMVVDGESTGIDTIENVKANNTVYNLNGQRVNANTKGIVIVNGRKFINK